MPGQPDTPDRRDRPPARGPARCPTGLRGAPAEWAIRRTTRIPRTSNSTRPPPRSVRLGRGRRAGAAITLARADPHAEAQHETDKPDNNEDHAHHMQVYAGEVGGDGELEDR